MAATRPSHDAQRLQLTRFAQLLRARRHELDLSQAELALRLGVRVQTISHWECGKKRPQTRFDQQLVELLRVEDRSELRELQRQPAHRDHPRARTTGGEVLTLVQPGVSADADVLVEAVRQDARDHPGGSVGSSSLQHAALRIIEAREGNLSETEAGIVKALLDAARAELNG
jgi:transcriptional regulator with XRE-family HTH domain